MSAEYPHLHSATRPLADESAELRIRRIRTDRWITYSRAEAALSAMEDLLNFPKRTRMPNLLLIGPTNNGKTMIVEKFRRSHPPIAANATEGGAANIPVLKVQMPAGPDEPRFFGAILDELGFPHLLSDRVSKRQDAAVRMLRETGVRILVIDEVHNLLSGSRLQQRRLLNLLRWLGNELQIPLVAVGTADALHAVQSDDQLANRFEPVGLPPWRSGEEYRQLLSTLEAVLPLRRPSQLAKPALAEKILSAAEGILGEIVSIVTRAAVRAVSTGAEAITGKLIDETGFISPSQRRRVAV
ncbi:MAG: TniB family NTP-binding protein [Steroidobacteraceae bacterium]